jgi:hypothetical protein
VSAKNSPIPLPATSIGGTSAAYGTSGATTRANQQSPAACGAHRHRRARARPVGEQRGERRDGDGRERPRQRPDAGLERRETEHVLHELREQEDGAEHPALGEQGHDTREGEPAAAEQVGRDEGCRRPVLAVPERGEQDQPHHDRPDHLRMCPAE